MPKRRTTPKQRAASRRNLEKARAARKPVGKSGLPIVEVHKGGPRRSKALQGVLAKEGAGPELVNSFNYHNGGWSPRRGLGTFNLVARDPKSGKAIGTAVVDTFGSPARGYSRSASVGQVFKSKKTKAKGVGRQLMTASAKVAKNSDLSKKTPTSLSVSGMVGSARGFYNRTGAQMVKHSSNASYSTRQRNKLAGKRVRIKRMY